MTAGTSVGVAPGEGPGLRGGKAAAGFDAATRDHLRARRGRAFPGQVLPLPDLDDARDLDPIADLVPADLRLWPYAGEGGSDE